MEENSILLNYFQYLRQRVKGLAVENEGNDVLSFTKIILGDLREKAFTNNPQRCDVELSNIANSSEKKRLNGYSWDGSGISVDLFITHYLHHETKYEEATKTAITRAAHECLDFLEGILKNEASFMDSLDSEPTVKEFATDLHAQKSTLQEARIFILTNGIFIFPLIKLPNQLGKVKITYEVFDLKRLQSLKDKPVSIKNIP
jgi:hypothetical protein